MQKKRIKLKFLSTMRHLVDQNEKIIETDEEVTVGELLRMIPATYNKDLAPLLFEEDKSTVRNDILVLVNDIDIQVLEGTDTRLSDKDEVVLMPVAHGG